MIFAPLGSGPKEVVDPDKLYKDFVAAMQVAEGATHWQFLAQALAGKPDAFASGELLRYRHTEVTCSIGATSGAYPVLPDDVGADANIWKIPFNRGWSLVGQDAASGEMSLSWNTEYPELVLTIFQGLYVRRDRKDGTWTTTWVLDGGRIPRVQISTRIDGGVLDGIGPQGPTLGGAPRGTGYGPKSLSFCQIAAQVLPAGAHTVEGVANQVKWVASSDDSGTETSPFADGATTEGVCIATRQLICIGLPLGGWLGA